MKYLFQNYPGRSVEEFERLSEDERQAIVDEYLAIRQLPGVVGGATAAAGRDGDDRARPERRDAAHGRSLHRREGARGRLPRDRGWTISTRRSRSPRGSRPRGWAARSRCGRWWRGRRCSTQVFRDEWGRVLANLVGFLGDFDLAEEAAQEAFAVAAERWPRDGTPPNPGAWLTITARNRAIDRLRRDRDARREDAPARGARGRGGRDGARRAFPTSGWS